MTIKSLLAVIALIPILNMHSAHAVDWDVMLDDLKSAGNTMLNNTSESTQDNSDPTASLDINTIISGLKQALEVGSQRAIETVSATNGFLGNADIRIPLPPQVEKAGNLLRQFGLSGLADEFETSMNRAAEKAAPQAKKIMVSTIKNMSIKDAKNILNGPDNAATEYFRKNTSEQLTTLFKPAISKSLDQVGSTQYYNQLSSNIAAIPVVGQKLNVNLPDYVTSQALDGLFIMLAAEEKKIRDNPAKRTTELLKTVFGQ